MPRLLYNKDELIADWKSGGYTERDIASKYKMSPGTAHKLVAGVDKTLAPLVSKQIEINQELASMNEHEVSKFKQEVDERTKHIQFFTHAAVLNVRQAMDAKCEGQADYQRRGDTILKAKETVIGKTPDTAIQINNSPAIGYVVSPGKASSMEEWAQETALSKTAEDE